MRSWQYQSGIDLTFRKCNDCRLPVRYNEEPPFCERVRSFVCSVRLQMGYSRFLDNKWKNVQLSFVRQATGTVQEK
jgi:hypothetical protein